MAQSFMLRGAVAAVLAALIDVLVFLVARGAGVSFRLGLGGIETEDGLPWYTVAGVAAAGALAGTAFAAVLQRGVRCHVQRIFASVVVAVSVLSCAPLLVLGLPAGSTLALASMHLLAGAVVIAVLVPVLADTTTLRG